MEKQKRATPSKGKYVKREPSIARRSWKGITGQLEKKKKEWNVHQKRNRNIIMTTADMH